MVTGPFAAGVVLRLRDVGPTFYLVPLFGTWLAGYLAFFAASGWLKAAPAKRRRYRGPLIAYVGGCAAFGVIAVATAGPAILGWVPYFLPVLAVSLWLARRRQERALLGGAVTIAAAAAMTVVARFASPMDLAAAWPTAAGVTAVWVAALMFGYFFGTVLYVKTMIRERGKGTWLLASVGWHLSITLICLGAATAGLLAAWWPAFFAATAARAAVLPWLATRRPVSAKVVGILEVCFSSVLLSLLIIG